jgi:hypothetical protein
MSSLSGRIVQSLRVLCTSLIPHHNGARLVAYTAGEVLTMTDVIEQESEEVVGFVVVETDYAFRV